MPLVSTGSGLLNRADVTSGFAQPATPPPPPTFVPTPIGAPPPPPTPIPTATAVPPATATPVATIVVTADATPAATVSPTAKPVAEFSLDAARVSRVNNPGNLEGLAAVTPGSKVWLMMYYTVNRLTTTEQRITTYSITSHGRTVFKISYRTPQKASEQGRFSRYTVYLVPKTLPYGVYFYHANLAIGRKVHQKTWKFSIARHARLATARAGG